MSQNYIVVFKKDLVKAEDVDTHIETLTSKYQGVTVNKKLDGKLIKGFVCSVPDGSDFLQSAQEQHDAIAYIEPDQEMKTQ
ncbi:hypothetical protein BT69DRAFT_1319027 [Atractiella rhizophila]|nr:hypothetical protein BT69DRAFT_1319027 [Atractiella rhizophila]